MARRGLESSMISEILIEESIIGWKEYELEVMRGKEKKCGDYLSIENFDPMGYTGDSITVAPAQTLSDRTPEDGARAIACIREIGVETGGSNTSSRSIRIRPDGD